MTDWSNRARTAPTLGAARKKTRQDQFQSPIGSLTPSQKKLWDGMSESERELTKYFFHVPDVDMKKIDLLGKYGHPPTAERRKEDGQPRFLNLEEEEGEAGTASDTGGAAGNTGSAAAVSAGEGGIFPAAKHREGQGRMPDPTTGSAAGGPAGPGAAVPGGGTDAAYRELLLRRAEKDPGLYSNPAFVRELRNAEQRMKTAGAFGLPEADSYSPERNWREAVGGVLGAVQNGLNALGTIGREMQAGRYASVAADQRFLGKLSGNGDYFDRADSLTALAAETADRALEPTVDFGSRYRAETEELYPYAGPAQRFLDQVIQGTASLAPTVVGNLLLPGSGPYLQMLQSVGGAMAEAKKRGADDSTALAYGAAVGIADTMLEKLVDGMGGVFGKGFLEQMIGDNVRQAAGSSGVREALIYLGGMAGEGFEEFLSVFANELLDVHMLGATARTWEALLEDAGLSFFASALVSGLVQGASRLGALVDSGADDLTVADLGRQLADDVEAELRGAQGEALASDSLTVDLPESAAGAEEAGILSPDMDNSSGIAYNKHTQVIKNSLQGKAYENKMYPQFEAEYYFTERQITIVMPSGTRIRVDAIGLDVDGNVVIMEYKSSATAKLTNNQTLAFEEFRNSGGYVVGKGKNFFYGGTDIPPMSAGTKIFIQRPGQKESW